ncbi:26380_t:CDS:2, partial [Gigaspora margarita]
DSLTQLYNNAINQHYQVHTNNRALAIQVLQSIEPDLSCILCYPLRYYTYHTHFDNFWEWYLDTYNVTSYSYITQQSFAQLRTIGQRFLACSVACDLIFTHTNQYDIYIDQPNYTLPSTSHIDNLETIESTPSQPIQSISSETIININSTFSFFESNSLNTKTSQTSTKFEQDQTTTFYSVLPSPIQILDSKSAPVSSIIPLTLFNISFTPPNILLLTSTTDHWSSVAINHDIEQSSSSSYTLLYPQLDTSNNFSSKISSIPILTQYIVPLTNIELSLLYPRFDEATWDIFYPDNYNTEI